jgi:hypothetical protein
MPIKIHSRGVIVFFILILLLPFAFVNHSCSGRQDKKSSTTIHQPYKPDTLSFLIKFESSLFPLPSPYQVAYLIKDLGIPYNDNVLNRPENLKKYTTSYKQALNLGIYGTDLSYINIYERTPQSISYLNIIKKLTQELGLTSAFSPHFFEGVERNINSKDSLLVMLSRTYRVADTYLKESDRTEIGSMVLAGGWIESVYILSQLAKETSNRELINRLGEQKHPLDNLIEVLTPLYYKSDEYAKLIDMFIDLAYEFDGIIYSYSYKEPKIDVDNKIIYINSESRVIISEYHLDIISKKIEDIRNFMIE